MGFVNIRAGPMQQSVVYSYIWWAYFIYYLFKEMLYHAIILIFLIKNIFAIALFFIIIRYILVYIVSKNLFWHSGYINNKL